MDDKNNFFDEGSLIRIANTNSEFHIGFIVSNELNKKIVFALSPKGAYNFPFKSNNPRVEPLKKVYSVSNIVASWIEDLDFRLDSCKVVTAEDLMNSYYSADLKLRLIDLVDPSPDINNAFLAPKIVDTNNFIVTSNEIYSGGDLEVIRYLYTFPKKFDSLDEVNALIDITFNQRKDFYTVPVIDDSLFQNYKLKDQFPNDVFEGDISRRIDYHDIILYKK